MNQYAHDIIPTYGYQVVVLRLDVGHYLVVHHHQSKQNILYTRLNMAAILSVTATRLYLSPALHENAGDDLPQGH